MKFLQNEQLNFSNIEEIETTIDAESIGKAMNIMASRLYSDIYSFIREITSNAYDAHIEANISKPIIIELQIDELNNKKLLFKDFGKGMSAKIFNTIYSKWFKSTRSNSNKPLGMYGLGSKSPLAYSNSFKITTHSIEDNTSRTYIVSKGPTKPEIHIINTAVREEGVQGTIIEIDLHSNETEKNIQKLVEMHTLYFDTVFYEGFSDPDINNFTIIEKQNFKLHSKHLLIPEPHIVMGPVIYRVPQLNFKYDIPIGIKFEVGELMVPPSRETVEINKESEKLIQSRYEAALDEIISYYNHIDESAPYYSTNYEYYIQFENIKFDLPRLLVNNRKLLPKVNTIFANFNYFNFAKESSNYFTQHLFDSYQVNSWGTSGLKYKTEQIYYFPSSSIIIKEDTELDNVLLHTYGYGRQFFNVKRIKSRKDFIKCFTGDLNSNYKSAKLTDLNSDRTLGEFLYERDVRKKEFEFYYGAVYDSLYQQINFVATPTVEQEKEYHRLWKDYLRHTRKSYSKEEILIHYVSDLVKQDWKQVKTIEQLMNEKKTLFVLFTDKKDSDNYKTLNTICNSSEFGQILNTKTKTQFALVSKRNEQKLLETSPKFKSMETISIELLQSKIPRFIKTIINFLFIVETLDQDQFLFIERHKEILIRLNKDWKEYFNVAIFTNNIRHEFYSRESLIMLASELKKWAIELNLDLIDPKVSDAVFLIKTVADKLNILDDLNIKTYNITPELLTKVAKIAILHKLKLDSTWYTHERLLEYPYKHVVNNFLHTYEKELITQVKEREIYQINVTLHKPDNLYASNLLRRNQAKNLISNTAHLKYDTDLTEKIVYTF